MGSMLGTRRCFPCITRNTFFYKLNKNLRVQKLNEEQSKLKIQYKEKICKNDNSEYKKFLSLGFPKTAIQKFKNCMKEK